METVFDFIKKQEVNYTKPIQLEDGWNWCMKDYLRKCFLYKNFQFLENNDNRELRPFKNIILAILNIQYRTEGFDVKDIELYVDDADDYYQSFLVKKFHNKWALENEIDTFIDDMVESYADYGGILSRNTNKSKPEVIDLRSLAFCNQTDILAYPFCIKHTFSASQLREWDDKWGKAENGATISIEELIVLAREEGKDEPKEIIIYELHGNLPKEWLNDERTETESKKYIQQIQIVAYYQDSNKQERGVCLFKNREPKLPFKFLARDKIIGRALGRSGIEELFEAQKWTNWDEIKITEMLEAASKMINLTDDPSVVAKHPSGLKDVDNLELVQVQSGSKGVWQMDTYPRNLAVFNNALERWERQAQILGAASDLMLGETPTSGTPFKLYEARVTEDKSMHRYRQGKLAVFMDEIYRDWILPHIAKEIAQDQNFLTELSADELQGVAEQVIINEVNKQIKNQILAGQILDPQEIEANKQRFKADFLKSGNKRFIKIFKGEITKKLSVMTNIVGKQKNLAMLTDKLVNVLRQYIATPQIRQDPEMAKLLNVILESSGLSPIMFGSSAAPPQPARAGTLEPLKQLNQANQMAMAQ